MIKNNALISRSANNLLKIIFELIVLIHHLYWTKTELGANISALLGPLAVGGFLFCSGYGVGVNYKKKGDEYLKRLSFSRIPYFYLVIIVTNLFYLSLFYLTGNSFTDFWSFIVSILNLEILRSYVKLSHWLYFISDLMLYYLLFVLGMIIFKKRNNRLLLTSVFILIIDILIIVVLSIINYITGSTRFLRACVLFPIGVLASVYNDKLCKIINKYKFILLLTN